MNNTVESIKITLPPYVKRVTERFYEADEEIYLVGGSLRDLLLNKVPHDYDLATSALPNKVSSLFPDMHVIETGLKHGTVTVVSEGHPIEITTFRLDGEYTDGRHPDSVMFTSSIEADLARRDFTVNAMAFCEKKGFADPHGGRIDLKKGLIRAVGDGRVRFTEDALRIMRAFRFSAQLGFDIEADTLKAAEEKRLGLCAIAKERIASELLKLLMSREPSKALELMIKSGVLPLVTGGYIPSEKTVKAICKMPTEDFARLGFFLSDADERQAREILNSLRYSGKQITGAMAIVRNKSAAVSTEAEARRFIASCGIYAPYAAEAAYLKGSCSQQGVRLVKESRSPTTLKELCLGGKELMAIGISGKDVGRVLSKLLEAVIEEPTLNEKETLLKLAERIKNE